MPSEIESLYKDGKQASAQASLSRRADDGSQEHHDQRQITRRSKQLSRIVGKYFGTDIEPGTIITVQMPDSVDDGARRLGKLFGKEVVFFHSSGRGHE